MSDGKFFGSSDDLGIEDRLGIIERKLSVLLERITTYDKIVEDSHSIKKQLKSLCDIQNSLSLGLDELKNKTSSDSERYGNNLEQTKDSIKKDQNLLKVSTEALSRSIRDQGEHHESLFKDLLIKIDDKPHNSQIESHSRQIDEIANSHKILSDQIKGVNSEFLHKSISDHRKSIETLTNRCSNIENGATKFENSLKDLSVDHNVIQSDLRNFKESIRTLITNTFDTSYKYIDDKINKAKSDLMASPASSQSLGKDISNRLDMVSLDASNAALKASNSSQQISILEKKVESILLNLKKIELSK